MQSKNEKNKLTQLVLQHVYCQPSPLKLISANIGHVTEDCMVEMEIFKENISWNSASISFKSSQDIHRQYGGPLINNLLIFTTICLS